MKILVDADACPAKHIIEETAKQFKLEVLMFIDTSHELKSSYSTVITVGQGIDAVDLKLLTYLEPGDIVVTQDYGLAALVLGKKACAVHPKGRIYTDQNIELLLFERHIAKGERKKKRRYSHIPKRSREDDERFAASLQQLCRKNA